MWSLLYQILLYTLAAISDAISMEVTAEVKAEIKVEVTAEVKAVLTAEIPAEVMAEVPAEVMAEVPAEVMAEVPAEVMAEVPAEVTTDVPTNVMTEIAANEPATIPAEVPTNVTAEIRAELPINVSTEIRAELPTNVSAEIRAELPTNVTTEIRAELPTNVSAEIPAELPINVSHEIRAELPTNVTAEIRAELPTNITAEIRAELPTNVTAEVSAVESAVLADERTTPNIIDVLSQGVQKEIQAVKQPINEAIINIGSTACENVKKLLGASYEQMKEEKIPDLDNLALIYKSQASLNNNATLQNTSRYSRYNTQREHSTITMNLTAAPAALGHVRRPPRQQRLVLFVHGFTEDPTKDSFNNLTQSFFVSNGQDPSHIHIIGFSLGAHIAGWAGKSFRAITGKLLGRISGLDPAGPCFSHLDPGLRLSHADAMYVDVTHTDAGVLGIKDAIGHKDYYPNSGSMQPNCVLQVCSHMRAWLVYGESVVNPMAFPAVRCRDWDAFKKGKCEPEISYMGYPSSPEGSSGLYFLQTGGTYPYGLGLEGVEYCRKADGIVPSIESLFG